MRYWHVFAGEVPIVSSSGWASIVIGPSEYAVPIEEDIRVTGSEWTIPWVQTLSREPTEADLQLHTPEEYR